MTSRTREEQLAETFVSLADTLVADYDVVELLHTLVERTASILGAADAGILLPADDGNLEVVASTSERSRLIGLLQLSSGEGPCVDAYETGHVVSVDDIAATSTRWPRFAAQAAGLGYRSMYAIPMRLRDRTIGSLNLFSDGPGPTAPQDAAAAQALADVATIGILHERALREADLARDQLQHALNSRVLIEQAKGVIAHTDGVDMEEAFRRLRSRARNSGQLLSIVAHDVVESASRR
jgi:GAF domain-containing protein